MFHYSLKESDLSLIKTEIVQEGPNPVFRDKKFPGQIQTEAWKLICMCSSATEVRIWLKIYSQTESFASWLLHEVLTWVAVY